MHIIKQTAFRDPKGLMPLGSFLFCPGGNLTLGPQISKFKKQNKHKAFGLIKKKNKQKMIEYIIQINISQ